MRAALLLAASIALAPSAARAIEVHVEAGSLTSSITAGLAAERPALELIDTPSTEAVQVVSAEPARWLVTADTPDGARILERVIDVVEGPAPALRLVVLLVVEALDGLEVPSPSRTLGLYLGASATLGLWTTPTTPTLGPLIRGGLRLAERLELGASLAFVPCCGVSEPGVVSATPLAVVVLGEAAWMLTTAGPLALRALGSAGVAWRRITGVSLAYAGPAPVEQPSTAELVLGAGVSGALALSAHWQHPVQRQHRPALHPHHEGRLCGCHRPFGPQHQPQHERDRSYHHIEPWGPHHRLRFRRPPRPRFTR